MNRLLPFRWVYLVLVFRFFKFQGFPDQEALKNYKEWIRGQEKFSWNSRIYFPSSVTQIILGPTDIFRISFHFLLNYQHLQTSIKQYLLKWSSRYSNRILSYVLSQTREISSGQWYSYDYSKPHFHPIARIPQRFAESHWNYTFHGRDIMVGHESRWP